MIGLDTNVLARYYVEDASDPESTLQREAARRLIDSGTRLAVSKSVLLELEWVMRGYYEFAPARIARALRHLSALPQVELEDRAAVEAALSHYEAGLDFADAIIASTAVIGDLMLVTENAAPFPMPEVRLLTPRNGSWANPKP